ncbi:hypothetical protein IWQ56_000247 [Coemansia nantahalensis]|nr:hypothetical protein IWQ56_000247 [Coemansia nantahalensis]
MPPRVPRRAAATARAAISAVASEDAAALAAAKAGTQKKSTARTGGRTKAAVKEEEQQESPEERTPRKSTAAEIAPPDTVLVPRRTRPRGAAAASPDSKPAPKKRRSPRGGKAAQKKPQPTAREEPATEEEPAERPTDESVFADDEILATPTKPRGAMSPLAVVRTPKSQRQGTATRVEDSPSPRPPVSRRGQKRPPDLLESSPLAKRSRAPMAPRGASPDDASVFVDIVSPSKFEASRATIRQRQQRPGAAAPADRGAAPDDAGAWRAKYEEMVALRQSEPEREYEEFRARAQERFDAAEEVVANLRKEIAGLKLQSQKKQKPAADPAAESKLRAAIEKEFGSQTAVLREQVETLTQEVLVKNETIERLEKHRRLTETSTDYNLRQKLRVMEEVTGLVIEDLVAEDQGLSYICKQSAGASSGAAAAAAAAAGYVLTVFDDVPGDYQYTPFGEPPALARLPAYLQEPISFERSSASMFYWRMCSHLHQLQADSAAAADSPTSQPQPDGGT